MAKMDEIVIEVNTERVDKAIDKVNLLIERIEVLKKVGKGIIDVDFKIVENESGQNQK